MIDISLKQLECFLELCRDFHFTNAAKRLNISQPPFSRHIQELELSVGTPLIHREGKRARLTTSGELFSEEIYRIPSMIAAAKEAALRAANGESKRLRIGFIGALLGEPLLNLLKRYRKKHPDIQLSLSDLSPAGLLEDLEAGRLDGAFLGVSPKRKLRGIKIIPWKQEPLRIVVNEAHPLAKRKTIEPTDLLNDNLVTLSEKVAPSFREKVESIFSKHRSFPNIGNETTAVPAILAMLISGTGFSILPQSALGSVDPSLVSIKLKSEKAILEEVFLFRENTNNEALLPFLTLLK